MRSYDKLLRQLEQMTHAARMRHMVELGRRALAEPNVAAMLDELERGGFYQRALALQSCYGSYDGARAVRALADPSTGIRGLAATLVPLICDDAQVRAALEDASHELRRKLIKRLWKRGRRETVDTFLTSPGSRDEEELASLIRWGTADLIRRHLHGTMASMADLDWRALARLHPDLAADELRRRAEAADGLDPRLVWQANAALADLANAVPDQALALVRALLRHVPAGRLELQRLVERRPAEMADLLDAAEGVRVRFDHVAHRLDTARLLRLVERHSGTLNGYEPWFRRLTPERRAEVYGAFARGWQNADGCLPVALIAPLPRQLREQEGRRHLQIAALESRPLERLQYAAFLPWDEARAFLDRFIRNPDAELRATALAALAFATRYHRIRLAELLELVIARGNEQDPVRQAMLAALADLPPGMWSTEHLAPLGTVLRQALDAADLSEATAGAAQQLVVALLPRYPAWGAEWLATLVRERGRLSLWGLQLRLTDDDVRRLAPALLPVLQAWEDREREAHLVAVAQGLGRRLRVFDGLVDAVERVVRATRMSWTADQALALIGEHRPDRLAALVPDLLRDDPTWITRPTVSTYLHRHRQDLLTPFLGQHTYRGRWSTGRTRWVLPFVDGFHRWTPAQQATFAATLARVVDDAVRDTPAILSSIAQLAALPDVPPEQLIALAADPRSAVREAALRALGQLDAGKGVPALLEALNDDRARIAIYALRRALLDMPAETAIRLLKSVPMERVTVAKEVVRLLGDIRSETAYRYLLELDARDLHRDVRVALLRAFWSHLHRDESWPIFRRAALSDDAVLARSVSRIQAGRLAPEAQHRLADLIATLLGHPDPVVRIDALRRCARLPITDTEQALLTPLLEAMGSRLPDESAAAAGAVFQTYTGREAPLVGGAIARLRTNRRALWTAMNTLGQELYWNRQQLLPTVRAVLDVLAADPHTVTLRVELAVAALPWDELAVLLAALAAAGDLHADGIAAAVQALRTATHRADAGEIEPLHNALGASDDPSLRRIALAALVTLAHAPRGWDEERLAQLQVYREDSSPLVAGAAQFTFPPGEPA